MTPDGIEHTRISNKVVVVTIPFQLTQIQGSLLKEHKAHDLFAYHTCLRRVKVDPLSGQ